jgi:hypothetical protein
MIFRLRRSASGERQICWRFGEGEGAPAVNSVPASCALLRNASKSRSWVTDLSRAAESTSVVYYTDNNRQSSGRLSDGGIPSQTDASDAYPALSC